MPGHHSHHTGGMLLLDTLAAHSGLVRVAPLVKVGFSLTCLIVCVAAADMVVGIWVAVSMVGLMVLLGKVPLHQVLELMKIPLLFLAVSCAVILVEVTPAPVGLWQLEVGPWFFCITQTSLCQAATLFFQAMGAVSCLYFLSTSTPMPQLIDGLRRCRVPELVIELMYLIYRYLFVLLQVQHQLTVAATARLGFQGLGRGIVTASRISGTLLAASFARSRQCFDAMEARGYDGKLNFLTHMPPVRRQDLLGAAGYVAVLVGLVIFRKGWL